MSRTVRVESLPDDWKDREYDLFICTLGYEERARYIAEQARPSAKSRLALGFEHQQVLSFETNADWFKNSSFEVLTLSDSMYPNKIRRVLEVLRTKVHKNILVDISSISRYRLASIVETLSSMDLEGDVTVAFVYALAAYNPPGAYTVPNSHVGPVSPGFAGWWQDPNLAVSAIVGLGYEEDRALGAVEYLQAADIWAFVPVSVVSDYSLAIMEANEQLLGEIQLERLMRYRVNDPVDCYTTLQSLVYGLSLTRNPILLPFGPKIFALCCLLVGVVSTHVPVWRVSAQELEPPVDRRAEGPIYGLVATFGTEHPPILKSAKARKSEAAPTSLG